MRRNIFWRHLMLMREFVISTSQVARNGCGCTTSWFPNSMPASHLPTFNSPFWSRMGLLHLNFILTVGLWSKVSRSYANISKFLLLQMHFSLSLPLPDLAKEVWPRVGYFFELNQIRKCSCCMKSPSITLNHSTSRYLGLPIQFLFGRPWKEN